MRKIVSTINVTPENIKEALLIYNVKNTERKQLDAELKLMGNKIKEVIGKGNTIKVNADLSYKAAVATTEIPNMELLRAVAKTVNAEKYINNTEEVDIGLISDDIMNGELDMKLFDGCFTTKEVISLVEVKSINLEVKYKLEGVKKWQKK